ncbi:MAG TPA: hypothetical protein VJ963_06325 [Bacteroidales bacterium]|nr:hypothetical protein [Bacteroidales bacterium]
MISRTFSFLCLLLSITFTKVSCQTDGWHITARTDTGSYTGVTLANGRIGIVSSPGLFKTQKIILNDVYDYEKPQDDNRIITGMNFCNLEMEIDGEKITNENISDWKQTLDMKEACLNTSFTFRDKAVISYNIYALRNLQYTGYIDFKITTKKDISLKVTGIIFTPAEYQVVSDTFKILTDNETTMPFIKTVGKSSQGKQLVSAAAAFIWHDINTTRKNERPPLSASSPSPYDNRLSFAEDLKENSILRFAWAGAECTSQDFADPRSESERMAIYLMLTPVETLLNAHRKLWADLWEGDIEIDGDPQAQLDVRLALYNIYSSGRAGTNLSIPPMGLTATTLGGHIFWDAELWIFPPVLLFNQGIAESMINYRTNRLAPAERKAANYGYAGAMYPWESANSGEEATPPFALTGTFEHHITADVAIAAWNYYRITKDKQWLKEKGFPMIRKIADFWVSRSSRNSDGSWSVKNVVGADEFAHNIDDDAFTNGAVITALRIAGKAAETTGSAADPDWKIVADNLVIHKFPDGITKEYKTYNGETVKQADVNLLAYPLEINTSRESIIRDLRYYEPRLAPEGPAMGKSVLSLIYARLGDSVNSYRLFKKSYEPNKQPPFGSLSESPLFENAYFVTGAGGMLQTILFGFGGLHITDNGIIQEKPLLPGKWESLTIKGVGPEKQTFTVQRETNKK